MKSLQSMSQDQIVEEIGEIRSSLEAQALRLIALSQVLYSRSRKEDSDSRPVYIAYSNAWSRFAGSLSQGLRRVGSADKLVSSFKKEAEEKRMVQERKAQKDLEKSKSLERARASAFGEHEELYGEELISSLRNEVG